MTSPGPLDRDDQVRRTTTARRGLVAVGATGAIGAAVAIGLGIPAHGTTATDSDSTTGTDASTPGLQQAPAGESEQGGFDQGRLAGPSGGGQPQGFSSGS